MLGYGYGVSTYPQFYDKDLKSFHMLPRPYIRSFDGQCSDQVLKKEWVLDLANRAETFLLGSIESTIMSDDSKEKNSNQYWSDLKLKLVKANDILPLTCRIGKTVFTSMAAIGGKLYHNHPKNLNHMHKDTKDLVSVIITLGKNIIGGDTVLYDGVWVLNLSKRAEIFVLESIESMIMSGDSREKNSNQYWSNLKLKLVKANDILPLPCRIGKTIFTSMAAIGGRLYHNNQKN